MDVVVAMPTAYILVNCNLGSEEKIISEIAKLSDVKEVRGTYGVHDIFVKVKSDNTEALNHTITSKVRKIPGITSTVTLVVIEEQGGKEKILDITFASWTYFWNIIYLDDDQTWLVAHYVVASNNC